MLVSIVILRLLASHSRMLNMFKIGLNIWSHIGTFRWWGVDFWRKLGTGNGLWEFIALPSSSFLCASAGSHLGSHPFGLELSTIRNLLPMEKYFENVFILLSFLKSVFRAEILKWALWSTLEISYCALVSIISAEEWINPLVGHLKVMCLLSCCFINSSVCILFPAI